MGKIKFHSVSVKSTPEIDEDEMMDAFKDLFGKEGNPFK